MLNSRVEHAVELLCHRGCRAVWGIIEQLDRGGSVPEADDLNPEERRAVAVELKSIMAVYARSCEPPG
ncbi:MAG: hypothetical protein MUF57_08450 [Gammaproteobacteria bacterium]|jgi:hypothetical protein|nr:hypothetical protein [Gammaproteobacteria bacterium]